MTARLVHIALIMLLPLFLSAQVFNTGVERHEIRLGEQVSLYLKVTCAQGDKVVWTVPGDIRPKEMIVAEEKSVDTSRYRDGNRKRMELSQEIKITSFDTGLHEVKIPPVFVNGDTVHTDPFFIEVKDVEIDEDADFADIKSHIEFPLTLGEILWKAGKYLLIAWAVLVLAALIVFFIGKDKKTEVKSKEPVKPQIPPHINALEKLDELEKQKLWQEGKYKEFHIRLSEISRSYLERRFSMNAVESTTGEIERQMMALNADKKTKESLIRALRIGDLAKFAKVKPLESENQFSIQSVRDFVDKTRPEEQTDQKEKPQE